MINAIYTIFFLLLMAIVTPVISQTGIDIQGHRGCRGLMPENSMAAFLKAVELGVTTLELDVVISMDGQIVVSHEPWISHDICTHPDGHLVTSGEAKTLNIYQMPYSKVQQYNCGTRFHPEFPHQQKIFTVKPTLKMVVRSVQRFADENKYRRPQYNIELISDPKNYTVFTPEPATFVEIVLSEIRRLEIEEQTVLQSSDINVLEELYEIRDRKFTIAYKVEKGKNLDKILARLSFLPDIYMPHISLINGDIVKQVQEMKIKIIPWPVNTPGEMDLLISLGVDGFITDYPDIALGIVRTQE